MPLTQPSPNELKAIQFLVRFKDLRVLEIGTGDGRLTWPFAREAAQWVALDPDQSELALAAEVLRRVSQQNTVRLTLGDARALGFPDRYFDLVWFTWSLC